MNIVKTKYSILSFLTVCTLIGCSQLELPRPQGEEDAKEILGVIPTLSRSVDVAELKDYVGRDEFEDKDSAVFVSIHRTDQAINQFTYNNIVFVCAKKVENNIVSIGWSRDKTKGSTQAETDKAPDRIYWTDATNPHTFIAYCKPQQEEGHEFDWNEVNGAFYGSLGNPTDDEDIDFRSVYNDETENLIMSGNKTLRMNDILLTHSTAITANDAIAKLQFYHGLAQVRVVVNISEFAASNGKDKDAVVSDMILKNMLTMYKWKESSVATNELTESDATALTEIYTGSSVAYNQRKNVNLWIPRKAGDGDGASRTFTFYGLAVPTSYGGSDSSINTSEELEFSFKVTYADPMNPAANATKDHTYHASIDDIKFDAGKCTTINISLNHQNEILTVGAEYDEWDFIDTPDHSELKKNSTFLASAERNSITILGDEKATLDDATWLYLDKTHPNPDSVFIRDIYGNRGTLNDPFVIKNANQLLSLAYEVSGTERRNATSISYCTNYRVDYSGATPVPVEKKTLPASGNFDFAGYYISLEAGLYLQPGYETPVAEQLNWPGIGVYAGHQHPDNKPFNGRIMGGVRIIKQLKGNPLFNYIGPQGHIDQLLLEDVISCSGNAAYVEVNEGVICASKVGSKLTNNPVFNITGNSVYGDSNSETNVNSPEAVYVAPFCALNQGALLACYCTAHINATHGERVGGIVGLNNGLVLCSYAAGIIVAPETAVIYGIAGGLGKVTYTTPRAEETPEEHTHEGTLTFCVYDRDVNTKTQTMIDPGETNENLKVHGVKFDDDGNKVIIPGCRAVTTAYLQNSGIVGIRGNMEDESNQKTLNGALYAWTMHPTQWPAYLHYVYNQIGIHDDKIIQAHLKERYFDYHVASYPYVY